MPDPMDIFCCLLNESIVTVNLFLAMQRAANRKPFQMLLLTSAVYYSAPLGEAIDKSVIVCFPLLQTVNLELPQGKRSRNGHGCQSRSTIMTALKTEQTFTFTKFEVNPVLHLMTGFSTRGPPRGLGIYE